MHKVSITEKPKSALALGLILALLATVIVLVAGARPATAAAEDSPFITVYPLPTAGSEPTNIISLGAGQVWFTMQNANAIGKMVIGGNGQATFTKYDVPTANSKPYDLAYDGVYIWFTERMGNKIGRLNPANGAITEYPIPTSNSEPMGIAVAPNGHVWFAEKVASKMARFKPDTGTFDEYSYTTAGAMQEDVATISNDSVWFTAPGLKAVIRLLPNKTASQRFEFVPVLDFGEAPWIPGNIAVIDDNFPWITAPTKDYIGRYAPGTLGYWRWYVLNFRGSGITSIHLQQSGPNYRAWFTEPGNGRAGVLITNKEKASASLLFEIALPGANSRPAGITVDAAGTAWIAAPGANAIMGWRTPYFNQGYLPVSVSR